MVAAIALTLIETAKLTGVDPQGWLTDVLGRVGEHLPACGGDGCRRTTNSIH